VVQVKIYALKRLLRENRLALSDTIHSCVVDILKIPENKRFHRFLGLNSCDFVFPSEKSRRYVILEISLFSGRSLGVKRELLRVLMDRISVNCSIPINDIEITLFETPPSCWGIRGQFGDELILPYMIDS